MAVVTSRSIGPTGLRNRGRPPARSQAPALSLLPAPWSTSPPTASFAVDQSQWPVVGSGFLLAGIGIGLAETAQSTAVGLMLPDRLQGNGFAVLGLVQSVGDLDATVVAGVLWSLVSPTVAFAYAAIWMSASVVASGLLGRDAPVNGR